MSDRGAEANDESQGKSIHLFETPLPILRKVLDEEFLPEEEELVLEVQNYCRKHVGKVDEAILIYIPDLGMMPQVNDAGKPLTPGERFRFIRNLQKLRTRIRKVLENEGAVIHEMSQTVRASHSSNLMSTGWAPVVGSKGGAMKISFGPAHELSDFPQDALEHDFLMPERVVALPGNILSVTAYCPTLGTLFSYNCVAKKLSDKLDICIKGMEGCHFLHTNGRMHGDVKPGNVFAISGIDIRTEKPVNYGVLFDLDGSRKIGMDRKKTIHTPVFCEDHYYFYKGHDGKVGTSAHDSKKDVFSWGITLLEIAIGKPISKDLDDILYACALAGSREEQEQILFSYIDRVEISPELKILIKKMTTKARRKRPELDEVIAELNPFLEKSN